MLGKARQGQTFRGHIDAESNFKTASGPIW